jgi:hypothetical protein
MAFSMQDLMRQLPGSQPTTTITPSFQPRINQQQLVSGVNKANEAKDAKNQNLAMMLYALGGAFRGQDPLQQGLALQEAQQQRQLQLQQEKNQAAIMQGLEKSGLSQEEVALYGAGLDLKDILEIRKERAVGQTDQQIIKNVESDVKTFSEETKVKDVYSNLSEAFGPADAIQEQINKATRFLVGQDIAGETGAAVRARDNLNLEILATLANDYTGRPSNLLLTEIKKVLPESSATSEKDAFEKYSNIFTQTKSRIKNLESGMKSPLTSESDKEKYREELFKSKVLLEKLDSALKGLKDSPKENLEPVDIVSEGKYSSLYLNNNG